MQVRLALFHVCIFRAAVASVAKVTDCLTGGDSVAFFNAFGERFVFSQVGVVVITQSIIASNTNAPAAIPVPAKFGDCPAFDCDYRRADASE